MRFKEKLAYIALGGGLVVFGQLLPNVLVPRLIAQSEAISVEYDTVLCRNLKIVDKSGKVWAQLEATEATKDSSDSSISSMNEVIRVFNHKGLSVYRVQVTPNGGDAIVCGSNGHPLAVMGASSSGDGMVNVLGKELKGNVSITVSDGGGSIAVRQGLSGDRVWIRASPIGGNVNVYDKNEESRAVMRVLSDGSSMMGVFGDDKKPLAWMSELPMGGGINVNGNDGEPRAVMGVVDNGGFVSVLGNNGETIGSLP